jgi:Cys-tRNA(Pro)/Cys-tRNA(Cys) deacylase
MKNFEEKLNNYIIENKIEAEHLIFNESCHSVPEAASAAKASIEDFVKNICLITPNEELIVAIVKGEDKVSLSRVSKLLNLENIRIANETEILTKTGYICGGVPSFGYEATFLLDSKVMEREIVYSGGGSTQALTKMSPFILQKTNNAQVARIRR